MCSSDLTLPLTAQRVVKRIITEKAVMDVSPTAGLTVVEIAKGLSKEDLVKATGAKIQFSSKLKLIPDFD